MSDGVSFDQHGSKGQRPPRRKGPNLFVIIAIALLAFMFMRRMGTPPPPAEQRPPQPVQAPATPQGDLGRPPYDFEQEPAGRATPPPRANSAESDWSLEEVDVKQPAPPQPDTKRTTEGEWSIEEVDVE